MVLEAVKLARVGLDKAAPDRVDQVPADRDKQDKARGDAVAPGRGLPTEADLGKPWSQGYPRGDRGYLSMPVNSAGVRQESKMHDR